LLTLLLASADELHQVFIPSRTASFHDVATDVTGGFLMLLLWFGLVAFFQPDPS
jgi:VanZ family protein